MLENILSPLRIEARIIHFLYIPLTLPLPDQIYDATSSAEGLRDRPEASL